MAPPNPKHRPRQRSAAHPAPRRSATLELPYRDDEVLRADDPRPQNVPVYPAQSRKPARRQEEAIPTTVYEIAQDEEFAPPWDTNEVSDPGHKPAFLYVEKGPGQGQLVPVKQGSMVIGRASISELRLQHPSVSRRHAQVTRLGERFYLKDLGSQNATFVNKVRLEAEVEVYPGDVLQVGSATIKLRGPAEKVAEETRKKLDKAQVQSARRATARAKSTVGTTSRILRPRSNVLPVTAACVGIAVGLAALGLLGWRVLQDNPRFESLDADNVMVRASDPVVGVATAAPGSDRVSERIAQQMEKAQSKPEPVRVEPIRIEPARPVSPEPRSAATLARRDPPRAAPAPARSAPAPAPAPTNAAILKLYEAGNVAGAISAARTAGNADLTQKLTDFQSAYAAGGRAEKTGDAGGAVAAYTRALQVDEKISGGWGTHGPAIAKKLGNIFTLYGQHLLKQDEDAAAKKAFGEALKYDPTNALAKRYLAGGTVSPAPAAARSAPTRQARAAAIDDAWGDEAPAAPSPKVVREQRKNAIDDAWGD